MEILLKLQLNIVLFLQKLAGGNWKTLWNIITFLANPAVFLFIFVLIYWNINKKEGARFAYNAAFILLIVNALKTPIGAKRPYQMDSSVKMLEADGSGTGSSFPSGHSALSSALCSSLFISFLRNAFWIVFVVVIPILVGVSRMVLGMHFPQDVIVGLALGYGFTFIFYRLLGKLDNGLSKSVALSVVFSSILLVTGFVLSILMTVGVLEKAIFSDLVRSITLLGSLIFGRFFEERFVKYVTRARKAKKILRLILGIIPVALLYFFLGHTVAVVGDFLLYLFIGVWCTFLFPFIGIHSNLFYIV